MAAPALASPTDQQQILVAIDPQLPKAAAHAQLRTIIEIATLRTIDLKVSVMEPNGALDWVPPKPLSLSDFKPTMPFFRDSVEHQVGNERKARIDAASKEFEKYFANNAGSGGSCAKVVKTAERLRNEDFSLAILLVSRNICAIPRVVVKIPGQRKLLIVPLRPDTDEDDCALLAEEARLRESFPQASLVHGITSSGLESALNNRRAGITTGHLDVRGCKNMPMTTFAKGSDSQSKPSTYETRSDSVDELRIISPRHRARVGLELPFQGTGARPDEVVSPVVRIHQEYYANAPVRARNDGSYEGTVIIGRPGLDCGEVYELRIFAGVTRALKTGDLLSGWPEARSMSLPVEVTRTQGCVATRSQMK